MRITKRSVEALGPKSIIADEEIKGFVARRPGNGGITYGFRYRPKEGPARQRWLTLGRHGNITVEQARTLAKKRAGEVADARDPAAEDKAKQLEKEKAKLAISNTVNAVLDTFVTRHVSQLRSGYQIVRAFDVYVRPRIGKIAIYDLKRRDMLKCSMRSRMKTVQLWRIECSRTSARPLIGRRRAMINSLHPSCGAWLARSLRNGQGQERFPTMR